MTPPSEYGPARPLKSDIRGEPFKYKATITFDFDTAADDPELKKARTQAYNRLTVALSQIGWRHLETSAFVIEDKPLAAIWMGIELVARQSGDAGPLSALNFQIQGSAFWAGRRESQEKFFPNAVEDILEIPLPRI